MANDRAALIQAAQEKYERDQLIAQAQAKFAAENTPKPVTPVANQAETGIRSALSGATLGLTEPLISGANALVGQGIEAAFAPEGQGMAQLSPEALKSAYQSDIARRQELQAANPLVSAGGEMLGALSPVGPTSAAFRAGSELVSGIKAGGAIAGPLANIVRGGASAGAGALASEGGRQAILGATGFPEAGPGQGIEGAIGAAKIGAGLSAIPVIGKAAGALAKSGFVSTFGVRGAAVDKFLERAGELSGSMSKEEISELAMKSVNALKSEAVTSKLNMVDEIQSGLSTLKSRVIQQSDVALSKLEESGAEFKLSEIQKAIKSASQPLDRQGIVGPAAQSAREKLTNFSNDISQLPETIDAPTLKNIIKSLDQNVDYLTTPGTFTKSLGQQVLIDARRKLDGIIKTRVPAYEEEVKKVHNLSQLLEDSSQLLGGEQRSFNALSKLGKPNAPIQDQTLQKFMNEAGIDSERFRLAQDNAEAFKTWSEGTVENKIQGLMNDKSQEIKNQFQQLSKLSDTDFVRQVENLGVNSEFEKEFLRGSRNVNLWTVIGAATGAGIGGGFLGGAGGAAIGALMDKYGPKMGKKVLEQVAAIQGLPTVQKIRQLNLPPELRQELSDSFVKAYLAGKREKGEVGAPISIPDASHAMVRSEIESSRALSAYEKASNLSTLNEHGEVMDLPKIMGAGEQMPAPIYQGPIGMPKPEQPRVGLKNVSDFQRYKRPQSL